MGREYNLQHLSIQSSGTQAYVSTKSVPVERKIPDRDRITHANNLRGQLEKLKEESSRSSNENFIVAVEGKESYDLESKSLNDKKANIELLRVYTNDEKETAIIRVPKDKGFDKILGKINDYSSKNTKNGKPKNKNLVESIEKIRGALLKELWGGNVELWPEDKELKCWWEIWLDGGKLNKDVNSVNRGKFILECINLNIDYDMEGFVEFPNRQATIIKASINQLEKLVDAIDSIIELDPPSKVMINYGISEGIIPVRDFDTSLIESIESDIRITVIDTGINEKNPFLKPIVDQVYNVQGSDKPTFDYNGHGTSVAGVAAYGNISDLLNGQIKSVPYKIESVRIPLDTDGEQMSMWGKTIKDAVKCVENTSNKKRVFNLSIGAEGKENGQQTAWSGAIDEICFNNSKGRLMTIAAGNIESTLEGYTSSNLINIIDDPGQALNGICVGGFTMLDDPLGDGEVIAKSGELSPFTRSGAPKAAIKPDVVYEAGNTKWNGSEIETWGPGISILTTSKDIITKPLTLSAQTSMASPGVARLLAFIWSENPQYTPTTIRGLLVHSAYPTRQLFNQFADDGKVGLRRACGYGVPDVRSACKSAKSDVCIIDEGEYEYFQKSPEGEIEKRLLYYDLPWPKEKLIELGEEKVMLKVTLSFFIEPNPKVAISSYEGASLAWDMQGPFEEDSKFFKRVNKKNRTDSDPKSGYTSGIKWNVGVNTRNRGTLQSDYIEMTAAELASCGKIVIYPRKGWWDNLKEKKDKKIPYSIIISVEALNEEIDLYTEIQNEINIRNSIKMDSVVSVEY